MTSRNERRDKKDRPADQRTPAQRDRDRILNTSAFRRLAGVTQVVSAAEGHVFHNRLTHSLEVAQIARRIAEYRCLKQPDEAHELGEVDPEVVEAAALAHDLGHPPFGHIAEEELDALMSDARIGVADGFEGNPQSFRILTQLAVRSEDFLGLNLTRATLNSVLKYPWLREATGDRRRKWGAYASERELFEWAREEYMGDDRKCVEAELMDWADDIAYAVHDVEDFYRAGLIPLERLGGSEEVETFIGEVFSYWARTGVKAEFSEEDAAKILLGLLGYAPLAGPYSGTRAQRAGLRILTSYLVGRYVRALSLHVPSGPSERRVRIDEEFVTEVRILKELTWHYVIRNPALAAQQRGYRQVVRDLFTVFLEAADAEPSTWVRRVLPRRFADALASLEDVMGKAVPREARARIAADAVAGLTEQQALDMHRRFSGHDPRSVLDPIFR